MNKIISIIAILAIIPQALAYTDSNLIAANYLAKNNIIKNWELKPEKYELDNNITRREMLKVMMNLSWLTVPDKCEWIFLDLNAFDWGCKYAEIALRGSFIASNEYFRPNDNITKIESLKLIMQAKYLAKSDTSDWREWYVQWAIIAWILDEAFSDYNTLATRSWIFTIWASTYPDFVTEEEEILNLLEEILK